MASSFSACLSIALRSVRESTVHDSEDRKKEAFCQYLSNIIYICGVLKDEAWQRDLKDCYSQETLKLFKLSSQCLERAQDLLRNAGDNLVTSPAPTETQATKETQPLTPLTPSRKTSQDAVDHSSYQFPVASQPNNLKPVQHLHHSSPPISPSFQRRVQYVDEAKRGNTQLLAAYRARMERREKQLVGNKRTTRKADVATMNLSLFRKMAENIEIAKTRQKSLEKKKSERQQRLREEADRRMGPSSLLTTDGQVKKEMYVKVLEFEQETIWLISFRDQLNARPEDSSLILQIINRVLGTKEHPLTKCLQSYQFDIHKQLTVVTEQARDILMHIANLGNVQFSNINQEKNDKTFEERIEQKESDETKEIPFDEELCDLDVDNEGREGPSLATGNSESEEDTKAEVDETESDIDVFPEEREKEYRRILQTVVSKVQFSLDMLHSLFLLVYEPFSSPVGQDLCLASVECAFIKPLWPLLLNLYRVVNYRKEARLAKVFMKNTSSTPRSLNVPDRLCLHDQNSDGENPVYPYQAVVEELESLSNFACPLEKLECIVRTNRFIVECVEDYYEAKGSSRNSSETVIGCDDLLPILCYVIIRSQLPQLVSECHAMEDFISADYLMGEEGYSLTTFQTALAYLETLEDTKDENLHEQSSEHEEQSKDIS